MGSTSRDVIAFFGLENDDAALERALQASSFEAMQAVESRTIIPGHSYDRNDRDALRVRRGRTGGYSQVFDGHDTAYIDQTVRSVLEPEAALLLRQRRAPGGPNVHSCRPGA
jgi:hypothetical protein